MSSVYDSGLDKLNMRNLQVGSIVAYRLLALHLPRNPLKVWRGKVVKRYETYIQVEMVEPGYEGLTETVLIGQIVGIG